MNASAADATTRPNGTPRPVPIDTLGRQSAAAELADFCASPRLLLLAGIALAIGIAAAFVALALLRLIAFFTNLFFYGRLSFADVSPAGNDLGVVVVVIPVIGALIVGLMARYGSERIRGHGIPEAIEAILLNGSRIDPRVAGLKPVSAAVSIGSGGPFGAEGPIIMTGGAFGSLIAQLLHLTSSERKTLLVAGAAAGMSATFAAPVSAVLLAVELLLFEWKPRSVVPVALASAAAAVTRRYLLGGGPLFVTPAHPGLIGPLDALGCVLVGLLAGGMALALTAAVYGAEDAFHRLPIHWMWWPAIGGVVIGVGGLIFPEALGVGYGTIEQLRRGEAGGRIIIGVLLVKSLIWAISLGSGTSGGVLAPLLMMGGAVGALGALVLPDHGPGFWPLIAMGAILGGAMRVPFTGVVFAVELTHDTNALLPLMIGVTTAYTVTVLTMRRSILTEKIGRRGFHVTREYTIDPLEILFAREVMRTNVEALDAATLATGAALEPPRAGRLQRLFPVVDEDGRLTGVIPASAFASDDWVTALIADPVTARPDEPLRLVVERMADTGLTRLPVVEQPSGRLLGMVSLHDVLKARARNLDAERRRERVLPLRVTLPAFARERARS